MRKTLLTAMAIFATLAFFACKKSSSTSNAKTVENLSGSYNLTALTWTTLGVSVNVYDSLPDCEKDNVIKLNTDLSLDFIDGVPVCTPDESDHGSWSLSSNGDSLYFGTTASYIKSWDGKTLVLTGIVDDGPPQVLGQTTLVKK
jgi:hypothetical protein